MIYNQELTFETFKHSAWFSCVKISYHEKKEKKHSEYEKIQDLAFPYISILGIMFLNIKENVTDSFFYKC